jgi:hypothetical protein
MAITTAVANSFKTEILNGTHTGAHVYKIALIKTGHSGTYSKATTGAGTPGTGAPTTANLGTDEVTASGTYAAGGVTLTGRTVALATDTGYIDFANMAQITGFTGSADGCMIYNDSVVGKPVLMVGLFSNAPVAATAGTFDCTIPSTGNGVVEIT